MLFRSCYDQALEVQMADVSLKVVSLEDLIAMKKYAGRPQDLADVVMLELSRLELKRAQDQE